MRVAELLLENNGPQSESLVLNVLQNAVASGKIVMVMLDPTIEKKIPLDLQGRIISTLPTKEKSRYRQVAQITYQHLKGEEEPRAFNLVIGHQGTGGKISIITRFADQLLTISKHEDELWLTYI